MFLYNALFSSTSANQRNDANSNNGQNSYSNNNNSNHCGDRDAYDSDSEWSLVDQEELDSIQRIASPDAHSTSSLSSEWACVDTGQQQNSSNSTPRSSEDNNRRVILTGPEIRALALRREKAKAYKRDVRSIPANERQKKARMVHQHPSKQKFRKQPKQRRLSNVPKINCQRKC